MWVALAEWIAKHSWREIVAAIAILLLGIGAAYEVHHQRAIGYDERVAEEAQQQQAAQAKADKVATKANAEIDSRIEEITKPLPGYLAIYGDKSKPADCAPVSYVRKLKP